MCCYDSKIAAMHSDSHAPVILLTGPTTLLAFTMLMVTLAVADHSPLCEAYTDQHGDQPAHCIQEAGAVNSRAQNGPCEPPAPQLAP